MKKESTKEIAVTKSSLLDIAWRSTVTEHNSFGTLWADFMRSAPFNRRQIISIFWRIFRIVIKRDIFGWELWITKESILLGANLDDLLNLILNGIFFRLLLMHIVGVLHDLLTIAVVDKLSFLSG